MVADEDTPKAPEEPPRSRAPFLLELLMVRVALITFVVAASIWPSVAAAQNGTTVPVIKPQFLNASGEPCNGCKLYTFASGTDTPLATYSNVTLSTPNANPVVMDSSGYPTSGAIYLSAASYKFRLDTSADVTIWTQDTISATHAGLTGVSNTGDIVIQLDTDNNTSNALFVWDGLGSTKASITEAGDFQVDGASQLDGHVTIGNASEADRGITINGAAQDFYVALDDSADDLVIGLGATVGTTPIIEMNENRLVTLSAGQLAFPASQNASAVANVLDDYEEGTWTVTPNANLTLTSATGYYVKVGKLVHFQLAVAVDTVSSTDAVTFSLPFTAAAAAASHIKASTRGVNTGDIGVVAIIASGGSVMSFEELNDNGAAATLGNDDLANTDLIAVSGSYIAAN